MLCYTFPLQGGPLCCSETSLLKSSWVCLRSRLSAGWAVSTLHRDWTVRYRLCVAVRCASGINSQAAEQEERRRREVPTFSSKWVILIQTRLGQRSWSAHKACWVCFWVWTQSGTSSSVCWLLVWLIFVWVTCYAHLLLIETTCCAISPRLRSCRQCSTFPSSYVWVENSNI